MRAVLLFLVFAPSILLVLVASAEDSTQVTREFRALEAKKVAIRPAAQVTLTQGKEVSALDLRSSAWKHFDLREWEKATDCFLSALELDPESVETAEGLAMSVYHSGDYASAFRLGQELSSIMPSVKRLVAETVTADIRYMISKQEFETANEFLAHFPATDETFAAAHRLVSDATTIVTALGQEKEATPDVVDKKPKRFVTN